MKKQMGKNTVNTYVTGMGIITSAGDSVQNFERALKNGTSNIGYSQNKSVNHSHVICGEVHEDSVHNRLDKYMKAAYIPERSKKSARSLIYKSSFQVQAALATVFEAFCQADLFDSPIAGERMSIIVSGNNLTNSLQQKNYDKSRINPEYLSPQLALQFMDTYHIGVISEVFGIKGEGFTTGGASASGNAAIIKAKQLIDSGLADLCIVVGSLADLTDMELQTFYNIGALGGKKYINVPEQACRPFDENHEGFIYGQGAGCLILENEISVKARGCRPVAEILGGVMQLDGNHSSNPNEVGEIQVIQRVLYETGTDFGEINYINAHGTSSPLGDETELNAIRKVFKEHACDIWINSTKGITGHCLYSAGIVEAIASIIQMEAGFVHPNINLDNPIDRNLKLAGKSMIPVEIKMALSNSFGFGGINTSVLLKNVKYSL